MILVAGLGNPGPRYLATRHNIGFMVADRLLKRDALNSTWRVAGEGLLADATLAGSQALLLKPATYMNGSGRAVAPLALFHKLAGEQLIVVHDELDLPFGCVRIKFGGGDGGHRGLRSITAALGCNEYLRVRAGIGRPSAIFQGDISDFVLQAFAPSEDDELAKLLDRAEQAVSLIAERGHSEAMKLINQS